MADMNVDPKSIKDFLSSGREFLIPEYQRQYRWDKEQCQTLWEDILDFFGEVRQTNAQNSQEKNEYYLGSIVGFSSEDNKNVLEIIDGQQRITTLNLLFRALYEKATGGNYTNENTKGYAKLFGKCIWCYDEGSEELEFTKTHLKSKVILDEGLTELEKILSEDCTLDNKQNSLYAKNFQFFRGKIDDFLTQNPDSFGEFCKVVLNNLIIMPIECKSEDSALRIFQTLNDRGLPLGDSDIIKSKVYGFTKADSRKDFIKQWQEIEENVENIEWYFRQYMHVLRAKNNDTSKEIALRTFFLKNNVEALKSAELMEDISDLVKFWGDKYDDKLSLRANQFFDILADYPNEYHYYLNSAIYFYFKDKDYFSDSRILPLLQQSIANLFVVFIDSKAVNTIKPIVFKAYTNLYKNGKLDFGDSAKKILEDKENFKKNLLSPSKLQNALISLNMYLKFQDQDILAGEVEHIFPRKWQNTNYNGWDKDSAKEKLESLGNKMWLEKQINIEAGNGYFGKKKEKYKNSKFLEANELAKYPKDD
ncbi:hypothetical protein CCY99_01880 [Helicobacter sp. 16-1353]|uniref:DUF262 domain-containing protein n=1 Tax=Helicobacter sp. 16-1353 TaxID=2004996 RepID=UPI000DCB5CD9|nr:DUF262 domain-containing protein [Helicobacter sp. 16-1353]RAX54916.1 hypothetical protein CCY99_01880 [Helicobacter sp. 16-1353]